jgi:hypothetical protein
VAVRVAPAGANPFDSQFSSSSDGCGSKHNIVGGCVTQAPLEASTRRYAVFSNSSRPISMRRISLVPAPIS